MQRNANGNGKSNSIVVWPTPQNKLLAALPELDWKRVQPHLSALEVPAGTTLCEPGAALDCVYLPATAIISLLHMAADGASTEIAMIGNEGLVGVNVFLGGGKLANRVLVQSSGRIYRLKSEVLKDEFARGGAVQQLLLRYTQALVRQISQTAVCNRLHSIDQQLCRWLLLSLDRLASNELTMTHELLANTLGVRRERITEAAHKLLDAGLITYHRGRITVTDRIGLETVCCECYQVVRREYSCLPGPSAHVSGGIARAAAPETVRSNGGGVDRNTRSLAV